MGTKNLYFKSVVLALLLLMVGTALIGSGVAPSAYNLIQNATVSITRRSTINFVNGGCVDNAGTKASDCTFLTSAPTNMSCPFTSQTTVVCNHMLGTTAVIVSVYDAASPPNLIIPTTEQITDSNNVTVTFSTSQSGKVIVAGSSGSGGGGGGGTPGGSATQWQYNNSGAFGGLAGTSAIPQTGWTLTNCAGFCTYNDFSANEQDLTVFDQSLNWTMVLRNSPGATYTIIGTLDCTFGSALTAAGCGLYISDGTKIEGLELVLVSGAAFYQLRIETMTNHTTDNGTVTGPTSYLAGKRATLKIVNDGTHRTFYYWANGSYTQFYQENTGTFLTETVVGYGAVDDVNAVGNYQDVQLKYWAQSSP